MIPVYLRISGFLSYLEPVEIDFSNIDLACISGANGAGKSSLLDAITWALFGKARGKDEMIIHTLAKAAEVILEFEYEGRRYRVQRNKQKEKSVTLEFFIQDDHQRWGVLTEHTVRETDASISRTLRLDYDTFVNASFFLQGKADSFAQQRPGDRKRIFGSVLGLEIWEEYRSRAAELRKNADSDLRNLDDRLKEMDEELSQEQARRDRLKELETELQQRTKTREAQEKVLEGLRRAVAAMEDRRRTLELLKNQADSARQRADQADATLAARKVELEEEQGILEKAEEIWAAHAAWKQAAADLDHWNQVASCFHQIESQRRAPMEIIAAERGRLEGEQRSLREQEEQVRIKRECLPGVIEELRKKNQERDLLRAKLDDRDAVENQIVTTREQKATWVSENEHLIKIGDELKKRIEQLEEVSGADCPLCGQPLETDSRERLLNDLQQELEDKRKQYRENQLSIQQAQQALDSLEAALKVLRSSETELSGLERKISALSSHRDQLEEAISAWQAGGALQLVEITRQLEQEDYALDARHALSAVDAELKALGYDAAAHDAVRQAELAGRESQEQVRRLDVATANLESLKREIDRLERQASENAREAAKLEAEYETARVKYEADFSQELDVEAEEQYLSMLREQENQARDEVGGARNKVEVLTQVRERKAILTVRRSEVAGRIGLLKQLEKAFGKDGVPALLIEQALPDLEEQANIVLDQLSNGTMSVRFITQRDYKDKKREDKQETLDICISDSAGEREYEMFSGGEAFRVNFAIRLALSRLLAQRAGARLQTLVIDEGFGSQDSDGRQRLIEAINYVRQDFKCILVITHLEELKDAFPSRIEVEKTPGGSRVRVVSA